ALSSHTEGGTASKRSLPRHASVIDPDRGSHDADALAETGSTGDEQEQFRRMAEGPGEASGQIEAGAHGRLEGWGRIDAECAGEVETVNGQLEGAGGQVVDEGDGA